MKVIILSIELINKRIELAKREIEALSSDFTVAANNTQNRIHFYEMLLQEPQVDLSETAVKEATDKYNLNGWEQNGYRQALKDLL